MTALPQEIIIAILFGGIVSFYLFVIFQAEKKDKEADKRD